MYRDDQNINNIIKKYLSEEIELDPDTKIDDLGMDSINYVGFLLEIEEICEIQFEDECLANNYFRTIGDIVKYVNAFKRD